MKNYAEKVYFFKSPDKILPSEEIKNGTYSIKSLLVPYFSIDSKLNRFIIFALIFFSIVIVLNVLYKFYKIVICIKSENKHLKSILENLSGKSRKKKSILVRKVDYTMRKKLCIDQNDYRRLKEATVPSSTELSLDSKKMNNENFQKKNFFNLLSQNINRSHLYKTFKSAENKKSVLLNTEVLPSILITDTNSMNTIVVDLETINE